MQILNLYCNRYGWRKDVVDAAVSLDTLYEWAKERRLALMNGHDYATVTALIPWKEK